MVDKLESVYDFEDRQVIEIFGEDSCLQRTTNGWAWAMPCTLKKDHSGPCEFNSDKLPDEING